jgi:MPBQ/MSBQ methyltransferase
MTTIDAPIIDATAPILVGSNSVPKPHVRKTTAWELLRSVLSRALHPVHLWRAASMQYHRKATRKLFDDHRLALYAQILPSDFLHYGFFDSIDTAPESMSLSALTRAQTRYAELLLELAGNPADPVLDVGCGMGGLSRMLHDAGYAPTALTPDKLQAAYVARMQPNTPVIRSKLEKMDTRDCKQRFGTIFTAESLQYLKLDLALPVLAEILKPGGKWVACDYFLNQRTDDKTCHNWELFQQRLEQTGWRITYQRDVTANVLPTLAFLHMLATRFGLPLLNFTTLRLRRKQPGIHHLLEKMLGILEGVATDNVGLIDPAQFARDRRYMMLVMERSEPQSLGLVT